MFCRWFGLCVDYTVIVILSSYVFIVVTAALLTVAHFRSRRRRE